MNALKRVFNLIKNFPKIIIIVLIVGWVTRLASGDCITTPTNNDVASSTTANVIGTGNYTADATLTTSNTGKWVDSGFYVETSDKLTITTKGTVYLCSLLPSSNTVSVSNYLAHGNPTWTNSGINVYSGDTLSIQIGASTGSLGCNHSKTPSWNQIDWADSDGSNRCGRVDGTNLMAVITTGSPTWDNAGAPIVWMEKTSSGVVSTDWGNNDFSQAPHGGYYGTVNRAGTLYFRFDDCSGCYDDNSGGFVMTVTRSSNGACIATDGGFTSEYPTLGNIQAIVVPPTVSGGSITYNNPNNGAAYSSINMTNGQYNPSGGAMYPPAEGQIWLRVNDCVGCYMDNAGQYNVSISSTHAPDMILSGMIMDLFINPIKTTLDRAIPKIFKKIVVNTHFVAAINSALILYITLYAVMFTIGLIQPSQLDLVIRIVKVGVLLTLISPGSWDFFSKYLLNVFIDGGAWLLNNMTGAVGSNDNPFLFLDSSIGFIFRKDTILKMLAVCLTFPIGLIYCMLIIEAMFTYVIAICKTILGFMMSIIGVSLLLSLAPFCIAFILFHDTQEIFKKWVSLLFRYTLEPIIVIVGIVVINEMIIIALHGIIDMSVCWKCAIGFTIPGYGNLFCLEFWMPWGYDNDGNGYGIDDLTFTFSNIMIFEIFTKLLKEYVEVAPRIAAKLTTTSPVSGTNFFGSQSKVTGDAAEGLKEGALSLVGQDKKSKERAEYNDKVGKEATKRMGAGNDGGGGGGSDVPQG